MKLEAIATYIESLELGYKGTSLFINEMPVSQNDGILLLDTYYGSAIDHYLPERRVTGFRIAVRSADYVRGKTLAETLVRELTIHGDTQLEGILVRQMLPMNDPRPYRRSVGGFWEFEVDVEIVFNLDDAALVNSQP